MDEENKLVLSVSRAKTFLQCGRRYYNNYIAKLPKLDWPHFSLGTLIHNCLEEFHREYKDPDSLPENPAGLMKNAFVKQQAIMEKEKKELISSDVLIEARNLLRDYMRALKKNGLNSKILTVEQKFTIALNDKFLFQGYVDRIDMDQDGKYHIKDYKTNKNANFMEPFQLQAYGLYLQEKVPDIDMFKGSYIMLRFEGRHISYNFNKEDIDKVKNKLIDIGEQITSEERWIMRPSKLCDWCDYKINCFGTW